MYSRLLLCFNAILQPEVCDCNLPVIHNCGDFVERGRCTKFLLILIQILWRNSSCSFVGGGVCVLERSRHAPDSLPRNEHEKHWQQLLLLLPRPVLSVRFHFEFVSFLPEEINNLGVEFSGVKKQRRIRLVDECCWLQTLVKELKSTSLSLPKTSSTQTSALSLVSYSLSFCCKHDVLFF